MYKTSEFLLETCCLSTQLSDRVSPNKFYTARDQKPFYSLLCRLLRKETDQVEPLPLKVVSGIINISFCLQELSSRLGLTALYITLPVEIALLTNELSFFILSNSPGLFRRMSQATLGQTALYTLSSLFTNGSSVSITTMRSISLKLPTEPSASEPKRIILSAPISLSMEIILSSSPSSCSLLFGWIRLMYGTISIKPNSAGMSTEFCGILQGGSLLMQIVIRYGGPGRLLQ